MKLPEPYFQNENVTLYRGDNRKILPFVDPGFDLLLTDPPYGINADKEAWKNQGKWGWKYYGETSWDSERPAPWVIHMLLSLCKEHIIWGGNYFADILPATQGWLVWNKMQRDFSLADGELAWASFDKALRIADISRAQAMLDVKQHPTQKPVKLMTWCLAHAKRATGKEIKTVLDPYAGSGTTLVACHQLGIKCVGIEMNEAYCEIIKDRLSQNYLPLNGDSNEVEVVQETASLL